MNAATAHAIPRSKSPSTLQSTLLASCVLLASMAAVLAPDVAFARGRNDRTGVNFGTTVRILGTNDRTSAHENEGRNTKDVGQSQALNPYIGYAFESFNLGLLYAAETGSQTSTETSADGTTITERNTVQHGKGLSLFSRFLFGRVFFFEAGGGLYQEQLKVKTEIKRNQGGSSFDGEQDEYEIKGTGPGYHLAIGLELQMGAGFYFTSQYQARMVALRDYKGGSEFGRKRSQTQKQEVLFGIAYYDR